MSETSKAYGPPSVGVNAVLDVLAPVLSGGVAGDERLWAERALAAAYDPANGLDRSVCLRDVMTLLYDADDWDALRTLERAFGVGPFELRDRAANGR